MGVLDIIIIAILALAAYKGYKSGFVVSIISMVSLIIALVAAFNFTGKVSGYFVDKYPNQEEVIPIVVFILLLVLVIVFISLAGKVLKKIIDLTLLGSFDNLAGALFSVVKWAFFLSVFLWGLSYLHIVISEKYASESVILSYIEPIAPFVFDNAARLLPFLEDLIKPLKDIGKEEADFFTHVLEEHIDV